MAVDYNVEICKKLEAEFNAAGLHRPMRTARYDPGTELTYITSGFGQTGQARVHLVIEKFVGGGFAGQVYLVKTTGIDGEIEGLEADRSYAMKILIPPSGFSRLFRNLLYWIGFQGPFQLAIQLAALFPGHFAMVLLFHL